MKKLLQLLFLKMIGGSRNERIIRARMRFVLDQINPLEEGLQRLTDEQLRAQSDELRRRAREGEDRHAYRAEAFALVREASRRARNHRQFDVQLVAGMVLDDGWIAEEATGEGKTVACYPAIYMAVLEGMHVHVVTVNDYLVQRDAEFARPVFELLGISVGYITSELPAYGEGAQARRESYQCDITYGTNSEFGFDYLRDNMKMSVAEQVQSPLDFAIVDEVDNILIDEARTPLIISGPALGDTDRYRKADAVARELIRRNHAWDQAHRRVESLEGEIHSLEGQLPRTKDASEKDKLNKRLQNAQTELVQAQEELARHIQHYEIELDKKSAHMTHEGTGVAQEIAGVGSFYVGGNMDWPHLMEQALRAHLVYEKDKEYVVQNGEIIIVDEFTGRLMEGRQWSDGLHQAVEAKEGVHVKEETQTIATITLQNYFKLYKKLAGMTGTAMTEANEFHKIYHLDVASIPTHRPMVRADHEDRIYADVQGKFEAIVEEIRHCSHELGRPVLVGTTSIEKSELLSQMLTKKYGIEHEVLNARPENAAREAEIVLKAGQQHPRGKEEKMVGNVTIATNMAGRGTDIKLGEGVADLGGLHIIGTERHEARRIDNQLRGRSGRQGDPGSSRFFLSLRDELMTIFAGPWVLKMLGWLGLQGDTAIEDKRISKGIERAQRKVEERNFEIRKNLLEYDEVMDHQRRTFYTQRQKILEGRELEGLIMEMLSEAVDQAIETYLDGYHGRRCIAEWAGKNLLIALEGRQLRDYSENDLPALELDLRNRAKEEANNVIGITLGEYMSEEVDPEDWDLRGLSSWAMSRFNVSLPQNQLRKMHPREVEDALSQAAAERIDQIDCSPLMEYLQPDFPQRELAEWANRKFDLKIDLSALGSTPEEARKALWDRIEQTYQRRLVEYPVQYAIDMTIAQADTENVYALGDLVEWANRKYDAGLTVDDLHGKSIPEIYQRLLAMSSQWIEGDRLEQYLREKLGDAKDAQQAAELARERFGVDISSEDLGDDVMENMLEIGQKFFRREVTHLERFVLLQIYDGSWKDHLLAMDHLKSGIGLRSYAEQDPRVAFKREGAMQFQNMLDGVRDKVTDMIFKVRLTPQARMQNVYQVSQMKHEQRSAYDDVHREMASKQAQTDGDVPKVSTIVRQVARVGRNDPCPCGSGKKYKKCCGQGM